VMSRSDSRCPKCQALRRKSRCVVFADPMVCFSCVRCVFLEVFACVSIFLQGENGPLRTRLQSPEMFLELLYAQRKRATVSGRYPPAYHDACDGERYAEIEAGLKMIETKEVCHTQMSVPLYLFYHSLEISQERICLCSRILLSSFLLCVGKNS
jgi:hypothetical protein